MRSSIVIGLCSMLIIAAPVMAQGQTSAQAPALAPLVLTVEMLVVTADGRQIGRVESLVGSPASPSAVTVIKDDHIVTIPASTLSAGEHGRVVTSLKYREIR